MIFQQTLSYTTKSRTTSNISRDVDAIVAQSGIQTGTCHIYMQHIVPDGDPMFLHQDEGPDDMSAHIRTVLTNPDLTVPVSNGRCALGIWQGIYLWEHRTQGHQRRIIVTVQGE